MVKPDNHWQKFKFTPSEFNKLRQVIYDLTGIALKDNKREMLYSRLSKRLRQLGLNDFSDYIDIFERGDYQEEIGHLVNAVTTNLTRFFRESHHYDFLKDVVIPDYIKKSKQAPAEEFMVWSAGCSSGMEAYSAAMVIYKHLPKNLHDKVKILATDIDTNMLNTGKNGIYARQHLDTIPEDYQRQFKDLKKSEDNKEIVMPDALKAMVHFKYLNLQHEWPIRKKFDVIFCRNVMIYFDRETRNNLIDRYVKQLKDQAYLFLGHAESLVNQEMDIKPIGKSIFQKYAPGEARVSMAASGLLKMQRGAV